VRRELPPPGGGHPWLLAEMLPAGVNGLFASGVRVIIAGVFPVFRVERIGTAGVLSLLLLGRAGATGVLPVLLLGCAGATGVLPVLLLGCAGATGILPVLLLGRAGATGILPVLMLGPAGGFTGTGGGSVGVTLPTFAEDGRTFVVFPVL